MQSTKLFQSLTFLILLFHMQITTANELTVQITQPAGAQFHKQHNIPSLAGAVCYLMFKHCV